VTLLVWPTGRPFVRAHAHTFGSTELDARTTGDHRFSPLEVDGATVPVIYAGTDDRTAAAETIFHRLPGHGRPRRVPLDRYLGWQWSRVRATRDLRLLAIDARLEGAADLVDGDALSYAHARHGAAELLREHPDADGFLWASRQLHDQPSTVLVDVDAGALCVMLVGTSAGRDGGVSRDELEPDGPATPFATPNGQERLDVIGHELGVTVTRA
jgi:hypothetical protein